MHGEASRIRDLAIEVSDPADGRRKLRRLIEDDDVDLIKVIYSTIPGDGPRLGRDTLEALVEEAHVLGRRIFAHVSTPDEAAQAIAAGVDGLEHMVLGDGEILERAFATAREREVFWTHAGLGTVEPGKEADFVVLRDSPPADIRNTRHVDLVLKRGAFFDPAALMVE